MPLSANPFRARVFAAAPACMTDDSIVFKSNKANGFAWLSNFWPDVTQNAAEASSVSTSDCSFELGGARFRTVRFTELNGCGIDRCLWRRWSTTFRR